MITIFYITASFVLAAVVITGSVKIVSVLRSIRNLEDQLYWRTIGARFIKRLDEFARAARATGISATGISLEEFAYLMRCVVWWPGRSTEKELDN